MPGKNREEMRQLRAMEKARAREREMEQLEQEQRAIREAAAAARRAIEVGAPGAPRRGPVRIEVGAFGQPQGVVYMDAGWGLIDYGDPAMSNSPTPEAEAKARATLIRFLNKEQRESLEKTQAFYLIGSEGNRYRIVTTGTASGSVCWIKDGGMGGCYCAYPTRRGADGGVLPKDDQFLGQMLQLITDENSFLQKANVFGGGYPPTFYEDRNRGAVPGAQQGCGCMHCRAARDAVGIPQPAAGVLGHPGETVNGELVVEVRREQTVPGGIRQTEKRVDIQGVQRTYVDGILTDTRYPW